MKKMIISAMFLLLTAVPAMSGVLFYDNCEKYPSLSSNGGTDWGLTQNSGTLSVSSERARAGRYSYKFDFAATAENVGKRVELVLRAPGLQNFEFNKEYWIAWSIYIPSNFVLPTGYSVVGQFHKAGQNLDGDCDAAPRPPYPAPAQPMMAFMTGTDAAPNMNVRITGHTPYCARLYDSSYYSFTQNYSSPAFKKGAWNDVVLHTIFRYNAPGITQMWLNGTKFIDVIAVNAHNDPKPPYFKLGFYASSTRAHTVYYDEIRIGDANSSYNEVSPSGSVSQNSGNTLVAPTLSISSD